MTKQMTDQEKIKQLRKALRYLTKSAYMYVEEGSWLEALDEDIEYAKQVLKVTKPINPTKEKHVN